MTDIPERALDMTKGEILADDGFDSEGVIVAEEEFKDHLGNMHEAFEVYAASVMLARMFDDEYITLGEYEELTDHLIEYEQELDVTLS